MQRLNAPLGAGNQFASLLAPGVFILEVEVKRAVRHEDSRTKQFDDREFFIGHGLDGFVVNGLLIELPIGTRRGNFPL
jgi:hypothetical protein